MKIPQKKILLSYFDSSSPSDLKDLQLKAFSEEIFVSLTLKSARCFKIFEKIQIILLYKFAVQHSASTFTEADLGLLQHPRWSAL